MEQDITDVVAAALDAIDAGQWGHAHELLDEVDDGQALSGDALMVLGQAAYGAGMYEQTIDAFERAHTAHLADGDTAAAGAAAVQVATYLMMDSGLMAPVRGWLRRAARLLDQVPVFEAHAWWEMTAAYECLMSGDLAGTRRHGTRARELGEQTNDLAVATMGRIVTARVEILTGDVQAGLAELDDAAVTVLSGELAPLPAGMAWCELVCAMVGLAQEDRAAEWTEAMERWHHGVSFGSMTGRCRVHQAEVLRIRGNCDEAEDAALHACQQLRPWMRSEYGWPLTELGMIRLRRGDLPGAEEAFLSAHEHGWDPQPGLALLRLAQGDPAAAADSIRQALAHPTPIPSKERPPGTDTWRAPLLEAQAVIAVATNDLATAEAATDALATIAQRLASRTLEAAATAARGRLCLARGDTEEAVSLLHDAVARWVQVGAPWEAAMARRWLAAAHRAAGDEDQAKLEFQSARSTFERIGAGHLAQEVDQAAEGSPSLHALPRSPEGTATMGVCRREGDAWVLEWGGQRAVLADLRGLGHLARMVAAPGREFHVLELSSADHGASAAVADRELDGTLADDAGPVIDDRARNSYKRRLAEIDEELDEAQRHHDPVRAERAAAERDFLLRELSAAVGLGGRTRRTHSTSERARSTVTRAIRYALARIEEHLPDLAAHLDHAVRTGTWCAYVPDPASPVRWES